LAAQILPVSPGTALVKSHARLQLPGLNLKKNIINTNDHELKTLHYKHAPEVTLNGSTWHSHSLAEFLSFLEAFIGRKVRKGRGLPRTPWQTALGRRIEGERFSHHNLA